MKENEGDVKMPVLFVGHGNPMNAIEKNEFSDSWKELARRIPEPTAILCISAHWETAGTCVTASPKPPTVHDFGGFPDKLYSVQYPAPGSHRLAATIHCMVKKTRVCQETRRGFDHGCWSVLMNMYPKADIPVVQMSIDFQEPFRYHYELAKELAPLRKHGILIIATGNIVHNLRMISWDGGRPRNRFLEWPAETKEIIKEAVINNDTESLISMREKGRPFELAIPTPEHYLPLLYAAGLRDDEDKVEVFNDKVVMGSIAMTSFAFGL